MAAYTQECDNLLKKRFCELANRAYTQGIYTFTDFLDMAQTTLLFQMEKEIGNIPFMLYGGTNGCERQIARFGSEDLLGYEMEYPIVCLYVKPRMKKFADELSHRDFLGAIMNLGIERDTIGDLVVKDKECYFFCLEGIAPFLVENLDKVKHTYVECVQVKEMPIEVWKHLEESEELVASERIDGVISKIYNLSRSQSIELFREKKIFVNGRTCENNSYQVKKEDVISVRGFGKFIYDGVIYQTKKDKLRISIRKYV